MQFSIVLKSFDGRNRFFTDHADIRDARMSRISVNQHRARAALTFAAAILAAGQIELIAQNAQQGSVRRGVNLVGFAVDLKFGDVRDSCFG
jgi:hypothetical protein